MFVFEFQQLKVGLINVTGTELITGVSGESEERIRDLFEQAALAAPCVLFIDEIEAISGNRQNAQKDMERRVVSQLISSLDDLSKADKGDQVIVIGATNRADQLDPSLRRAGRFDQEISLGFPDREARAHILRIFCNELKLEGDFDYDLIASLTPGYVGSDLMALANCARNMANERYLHRKEKIALVDAESAVVANANEKPVEHIIETLIAVTTDDTPNTQNTDSVPLNGTNAKHEADAMEIPASDANKEEEKTDVPETDDKANEQTSNAADPGVEGETKIITAPTETDNTIDDEMVGLSKENGDDVAKDSTNIVVDTPITHDNSARNALTLEVLEKWLSDASALIGKDEEVFVTLNDFKDAVKLVQPSSKREGFITVPDVTWDDIGSLQDIRKELNLAITAPVKYPKQFKALGMKAPAGVLLCGPPGA